MPAGRTMVAIRILCLGFGSNHIETIGIRMNAMHPATITPMRSPRLFHSAPSIASVTAGRVDPDRADVDAAVRGNVQAFEALYRRHAGRVHGVLRRLSGPDVARAEEWTQEAFVLAWQRLGTFRGDSAFSTWLHRLAVNVALMSLRSTRRGDSTNVAWDDDVAENGGSSFSDLALRLDLADAVASLPTRARAILILHDIEGWKHEEIGVELGIAVGTSKAQLHRARALLRRYLEHTP